MIHSHTERHTMPLQFPFAKKRTPRSRAVETRRDPFATLSSREWWDVPVHHPEKDESR